MVVLLVGMVLLVEKVLIVVVAALLIITNFTPLRCLGCLGEILLSEIVDATTLVAVFEDSVGLEGFKVVHILHLY